MNLLDIYKRLPRNNCGKCPAMTCMSFAVKLSNKEHSVSECPELNEQLKKEIDGMLSDIRDWKEKRINELFQEISRVNFSDIAYGIGALNKMDTLGIKYMGREVVVSHSDFKESPGIWDALLILMYIKKAGSSPLSGKWVAFRDLKNGSIRAEDFNKICEFSLAKMFEMNKEKFLSRLNAMGAEKVTGFSTKHSFVVYPLPKIPVLILIWPGEEDFETSCKVLLDSTATEFLDVEALLYLGQAFVKAMKS